MVFEGAPNNGADVLAGCDTAPNICPEVWEPNAGTEDVELWGAPKILVGAAVVVFCPNKLAEVDAADTLPNIDP